MARNTLEAVFGALGAGLTGYGRERREQQELEEKRRREAMQESLQAVNLLASGRVGTEAQLQQSRGQAFESAGQMAMGALGRGPSPRIPRMQDVLNVGEAARRGPTPPMFEIGGQRLGVIRTQADEEREKNAMAMQQAAIERDQRLADEAMAFERAGKQKIAEIQEAGRQERLTQANRPTPGTLGNFTEQQIRTASTLRDDFRVEPAVKRAEMIADATRLVTAAASSPTAAGDLSLIFAYMRVLDPTSVVREREFANAQNAAGVPDQVRNLYNRVLSGQRLNDKQRADFVARAYDIAEQQSKSMQTQIDRFGKIADNYGVPRNLVVYDPFEELLADRRKGSADVDLSGNPFRQRNLNTVFPSTRGGR